MVRHVSSIAVPSRIKVAAWIFSAQSSFALGKGMLVVKLFRFELKSCRINVSFVLVVIMSQTKSVVLMHAEYTKSVGHTKVMTSIECSRFLSMH